MARSCGRTHGMCRNGHKVVMGSTGPNGTEKSQKLFWTLVESRWRLERNPLVLRVTRRLVYGRLHVQVWWKVRKWSVVLTEGRRVAAGLSLGGPLVWGRTGYLGSMMDARTLWGLV